MSEQWEQSRIMTPALMELLPLAARLNYEAIPIEDRHGDPVAIVLGKDEFACSDRLQSIVRDHNACREGGPVEALCQYVLAQLEAGCQFVNLAYQFGGYSTSARQMVEAVEQALGKDPS